MHCEERLIAYESWMKTAVSGGDWPVPLCTSVQVLGARAAVAVWYDYASGGTMLSASTDADPNFVALCAETKPSERTGGVRHGTEQVSWVQVRPDGDADGELSFFVLAKSTSEEGLLREIALVAAQAISTRNKLKAVRATSALKTAAFDQLPFGVVIVDKNVRIAERNEACGALLARSDGLTTCQERLLCREQGDQAALMLAVERALSGELSAAVLKVHRSGGAQPYVVRVVAAGGEAAREHCLLMIVDPDDEPAAGSEIWRAMFDLTECELIIAEGLVSGRRITEIANQRGVSIETVRSQTKRMFERLNVSSQAEAAARLSRSAPFKPVPA